MLAFRGIFGRFGLIVVLVYCLVAGLWGGSVSEEGVSDNVLVLGEGEEFGEELLLFEEIPTVVFSASKYEQKLEDVPAAVTIITADDIVCYGYRTLGEILGSVQGMYISYDRNYTYLGVRGVSFPGDFNSRVLLLVDGFRTNDNTYSGALFGEESVLDVDLIDRVEIIHGPGSSLYGDNAYFGVINVITKKGKQVGGVELSGAVGSFGSEIGRVSFGKAFDNGVDLIVSGTAGQVEGQRLYFKEFDTSDTFHGNVDYDGQEYETVFAKLNYKGLRFEFAGVDRYKEVPTAPWEGRFGTNELWTVDRYLMSGVTYEREVSEDVSVLGRLSYHYVTYNGEYPYDYAEEGDPPYYVTNIDKQLGKWWSGEFQFLYTKLNGHTITAGVEGRYDVEQEYQNYDDDVYMDFDKHGYYWGVYAQDEYRVTDRLAVTMGVRYDDYDAFGDVVNPRVSLVYKVSDVTRCKLMYGEAFRAPNIYELYQQDWYSVKPNPDLLPEEIETYEMVVEHSFDEQLRGSVSLFRNDMNELITLEEDPDDGLLIYENRGRATVNGVECGLDKRWDNGVTGKVSYAYAKVDLEEAGQEIVNSPENQVGVKVRSPLWNKRATVGFETMYIDQVRTLGGNWADDYIVSNVNVTFRDVVEGLDISAGIYNVFDEGYGNPGFSEHEQDVIERDGRNFRVKFVYRF